MSVMPLAWHELNLKNAESWLKRQEQELARMQLRIERDRAEIAFRRLQVETAKKEGKTKFDSDKYLKARKP